ncbi:sporulation protein YpjB [Bacillus taeanensis]|uniref:sporulation protein YpjB n=1 Tax=Bacillus taeanensis TaxID=273032 RepID=UPI0015F09B10|nr:sporulation protein YpjB [Bacillus taeanensis]
MIRKIFFIIYIIFTCSVLLFGIARAEENDWNELDKLADQVLRFGKGAQYEESKKVLNHFSELFKERQDRLTLSLGDLKVISTAYENAEEAVTSASMREEERIRKLTSFRLVVDAVNETAQPLWKNTQSLVMDSFIKVETSLKEGNEADFQFYLNEFFGQYELIRPALTITLSKEKMTRLNSNISFLEKNRTSLLHTPERAKHLSVIEEELNELFGDSTQDAADPSSLFWMILSIGSIIIFTLFYVGWQKYKGERRKGNEKNRDY